MNENAAGNWATVTDHLRSIEEQLSQLLEAGWRHSSGMLPELAAAASELDASGLPAAATRLRAVVAAADAVAGLAAASWALATCRQLRLRLPAENPVGDWRPLVTVFPPRRAPRSRLLPVARMALAGGEAWSCLRLAGGMPSGLILLAPPTEDGGASGGGRTSAGAPAKPARDDTEATLTDTPRAPWLQNPLRGYPRWQGRFPIGETSMVDRFAVEQPEWLAPVRCTADPIGYLRGALRAGDLNWWRAQGRPPTALELVELTPRALDACEWPDHAAREVCRTLVQGPRLALVWAPEPDRATLGTPLALIEPPRWPAPARLVHLVAGGPRDPIPDAAP